MSDQSGTRFNKRFKNISQPEQGEAQHDSPGSSLQPGLQPGGLFKRGDVIDQNYEIYDLLGSGGFGIVYKVYDRQRGIVFALKTFKDEFLADLEVRKRFQKEASIWVELGYHPYLVPAAYDNTHLRQAFYSNGIHSPQSGRLKFTGWLPGSETARFDPKPALGHSVCHGMEYANSKGVRGHRDLKPNNIMITQEGIAKITDFGLAGVLEEFPALHPGAMEGLQGALGLSGQTMCGTGFGTPTHMPPEQFQNAAGCDVRSDIYSFGVVLFQMAAGGSLPFPIPLDADWKAMYRQHCESAIPRLDSPLFPAIRRCLEKSPEDRYQTFQAVRAHLEPLLKKQTGEVIISPQWNEFNADDLHNKGVSLISLGRYEEANALFDKVLEVDPRDEKAWDNKSTSLYSLGRYEEAIFCVDKALLLNPNNKVAWDNKGISLHDLGRYEEAIQCYDKALELDPNFAAVWDNKGTSLNCLDRCEEATLCFDKALELDPRNTFAWKNKADGLYRQGRYEEAILCLDKALEIDPLDATAWQFKAESLGGLGRFEEANFYLDKYLELDPDIYMAWYNKGLSLYYLRRFEEAIRCHEKALELEPGFVDAWYCKALAEEVLGNLKEAEDFFQRYLALTPDQDEQRINYARQRLQELKKK